MSDGKEYAVLDEIKHLSNQIIRRVASNANPSVFTLRIKWSILNVLYFINSK
jgi:hypothetical protein